MEYEYNQDKQLVEHNGHAVEMPAELVGIREMSVAGIIAQAQKVHELMRLAMKKDLHYGVIPYTNGKMVLFKPGAEKILLLFGFRPDVQITQTELGDMHREYSAVCTIYHRRSGEMVCNGYGTCNTREDSNKRGANKTFDNPANFYNRCLKMAKKRAIMDAVITGTAVSDVFTQDMEEFFEEAKTDPETEEWKSKLSELMNRFPKGDTKGDQVRVESQKMIDNPRVNVGTLKNYCKRVEELLAANSVNTKRPSQPEPARAPNDASFEEIKKIFSDPPSQKMQQPKQAILPRAKPEELGMDEPDNGEYPARDQYPIY